MSIKEIAQAIINKNPIQLKSAFTSEMQSRIGSALAAKMNESEQLDEGWFTKHVSPDRLTSLEHNYIGKDNSEYYAFHYPDSKKDSNKQEFLSNDYQDAIEKYKTILKNKLPVNESRIEKDLDDSEPRIVSGVKGVKSTPFKKTFKNQAHFDKWFDEEGDNHEIHTIERK